MAGNECLPMKMKRKDIDRVNDSFSDFSLSSPARKIRRLDVELPPIMEEDEAEMAMAKPVAQESKLEPVNEERAIVVYNPPQAQQPYSGNLYVDADLISGYKNKFLRAGFLGDAGLEDDDFDENRASNNCRAVIPWSHSEFPTAKSAEPFRQPCAPEIIELDETGEDAMMEAASMEIEEDSNSNMSVRQEPQFTHGFGQMTGMEGWIHWQQPPHCMIPYLPPTNTTPISWTR
ncbi:PREDICTED: uncharacterized protein LOC104815319 [Tarenaya hassleriana]|uniref:uncharacterized protein LOC104815319 n=1 Tax=Tarenaya hassleriana TaxID=28532 RepID=UPI00053C1BA8|nr:PREDICTED: uncharacterized protein LOC104815319 [Tarenaya hassleriana]